MLNALDVSRYIINYSHRKDYEISNLRLQKLLYFLQTYYVALTELKKPLFREPIIAVDFGPIVFSSYNEFKAYGSGTIPFVNAYFKINMDDIWNTERVIFNEEVIPSSDKKNIEKIIDHLAEYTTTSLLAIIHNQKPWKDAYKHSFNKEISLESIRDFFVKNKTEA